MDKKGTRKDAKTEKPEAITESVKATTAAQKTPAKPAPKAKPAAAAKKPAKTATVKTATAEKKAPVKTPAATKPAEAKKAPAKKVPAKEVTAPKKAAAPEEAPARKVMIQETPAPEKSETQSEPPPPPPPPKPKLKVLIAASEVVPFSATGGMGQVAGALATTLARNEKDLDIRVVTPLYSSFRDRFEPQMYWIGVKRVNLAWRYDKYCGVFRLEKDGVTYYFIDNRAYFERNSAYGHYDDGERFAFFAKAVFSVIDMTGFVPDIIHAHDWQTALVPIYVKTRFSHLYSNIKTVFTLHNMEYQGKFASFTLTDVFDLWTEEEWAVTQWETAHTKHINLMKGAIVYSDRITTVSPTYANEIQVAGAYGLEQIIRENSYKLRGIINGIDVDEYDPASDPALIKNFTVDTIDDKAESKRELQHIYGLHENPHSMLFCVVSRLVAHKGMDLIKYMVDEMLRHDTQFALLGTGDPDYEWFFGELAARYPGKVGVKIAFDPVVANKTYAGSDATLMPSSTEPCGLGQMIACRYGTIPIVRKTGGLADSIRDCRAGDGNGFVFTDYTPGELFQTVAHAYDMYFNHKDDWKNLMRAAMNTDFSWNISAKAYADLYRSM